MVWGKRRPQGTTPRLDLRTAAGALLVAAVASGIAAHFHAQFWYAPDEGTYAHAAWRLFEGDVLHRDVQDIHPGYIHWVNAAALALFGPRLVSLRYPLAATVVLQALLVFALLRPKGAGIAVAGGVAAAALGAVQFLNPTASWYCLVLGALLIGVLSWMPRHGAARITMAGFVWMTLTLFRQLSGAIAGVGLLVWLLAEPEPRDRPRSPWVARALLGTAALGLTAYVLRFSDPLGWVLLGAWPVGLAALAAVRVRADLGDVARRLGQLALGATLAAAPLVAYHLAHGTVGVWLRDATVVAASLPTLPFFEQQGYSRLLLGAANGFAGPGADRILNAAFWASLLLAGPALGAVLLGRALRTARLTSLGALPVLACFFAPVSLHFQIPIYLFYSAGLTMAGLLWAAGRARAVVAAWAVGLALVGLRYQAGQPLSRGLEGILRGERVEQVRMTWPERAAGLAVTHADRERYAALVTLVREHASPGETIFAFPNHPELYVLAERRGPFRWVNVAFGVRGERELRETLAALERAPPRVVVFEPRDKYRTGASDTLIGWVRERYRFVAEADGFEVYALRRSTPS